MSAIFFVHKHDGRLLKNPAAHGLHWIWAVVDIFIVAYSPGGHLVWAVHHSKGQPIGDANEEKGKSGV